MGAFGSLSQPRRQVVTDVTVLWALNYLLSKAVCMLRKASQRPIATRLQSRRDALLAPDDHGRNLLESQTLYDHPICGRMHIRKSYISGIVWCMYLYAYTQDT